MSDLEMCGARQGRVVTHAMESPVRPATQGRRVVSRTLARLIAGSMVVRWRANLPVTGQTLVHGSTAGRRDRVVWG
jgi:hypothetical protein